MGAREGSGEEGKAGEGPGVGKGEEGGKVMSSWCFFSLFWRMTIWSLCCVFVEVVVDWLVMMEIKRGEEERRRIKRKRTFLQQLVQEYEENSLRE